MGNYENLKQSITEVIKTNGNQEITGAVLQSTLLTIISTVGANATFAGIATPATNPGTPDGSVFYLAFEGGTYTNFNAIELQDGLSVLLWNSSSWSSQQIFGVDNEPNAGSDNLVKSGGVQEELALGAVYDVSAKNPTAGVNNDGKWESLSALLSDANLSTLIPTSARKGGMSIKFIQSSNNKYAQYRLTSDTFNTTEANWQSVNNDEGQKNLVSIGDPSDVIGTSVRIAGYNFIYANIDNVEYRNMIQSGTYDMPNINSVLYVIPQPLNDLELTPQITTINSDTEWNALFNQKNLVILAYTNAYGKVIFRTKPIQYADVVEKCTSMINTNNIEYFPLINSRLDVTTSKIAEVDSWLDGEYDGNGNITQHGGRHAEVNWDPSRPEITVVMDWSLQGSVRHILAKDTNNNITSIFAPVGDNWYYPIIVSVPSNTVQLLVSQYDYLQNYPLGNNICKIIKGANGSLGLIDRSPNEIINQAKLEILGTHDINATSFPNVGLCLKADGTTESHEHSRLTDFISISGKFVKQITCCFQKEYLGVAFYSEANESSFISGLNNIDGAIEVYPNIWYLQTYTNVPIPEGALYMRVTTNTTLSNQEKIILSEFNQIPGSIYSDAPGVDEYFTYSVDCGNDDIEDSLKSTNIQGETILGTDNGYIRFANNYSKSGKPTPLVILNHGAGGSVTNNSTENGSSTFAKLLAKKGYNVLCINGVPTTFRNTKYLNAVQNGAAAHMGGWVYQRSAICAYKYVTQKYNISKDGCAIIGRSMGGVTSLNLAMLGSIPVKVLALDAPVIDSYKDAYFSGGWSGGTLGGGTAAIFAWIFQWDYCDFTNDTYSIPVGTYIIHDNTYNVASAEAKPLASLKNSTTDMIIMWYLNRKKMAGYNAYKTANFLISNLDNNYVDNQTTDNDDMYYGKKLPCPCKIWFGSGDTVNQQTIAQRFIQIARNGGSVANLRTVPSNVHCVWEVFKALDGTTDISVIEDGIRCSPYGVELAEWIMRYLPNVSE